MNHGQNKGQEKGKGDRARRLVTPIEPGEPTKPMEQIPVDPIIEEVVFSAGGRLQEMLPSADAAEGVQIAKRILQLLDEEGKSCEPPATSIDRPYMSASKRM